MEIPSIIGEASDFSKHGREEIRRHLTPVRAGETGELGFHTSDLLLLSGEYYLNVSAFDLDQPMPIPLDEITRAIEFSVTGVVSHIGVFLHPGEWKRIE